MKRPKPNLKRALGPRQQSILQQLWSGGAQTPVEIHRALSEREELAYTTVFTELGRLIEKGLVRKRGTEHKAVVYEAVLTKERFVAETVSSVLSDLLASHGAAAIHGFVDLVAGTDGMSDLNEAIRRSEAGPKKPSP